MKIHSKQVICQSDRLPKSIQRHVAAVSHAASRGMVESSLWSLARKRVRKAWSPTSWVTHSESSAKLLLSLIGTVHEFADVVIPIPVLSIFRLLAWNSREVTNLRTLMAQLRHNTLADICGVYTHWVAYPSVLFLRCSRIAAACLVVKFCTLQTASLSCQSTI
jgi:hypothetical protein